MSSPDFIKGVCRHCDGHLEFPATAVGATVDCPHCGKPIVLTDPVAATKSRPVWILGAIAVAVVAIALAGIAYSKREARPQPPSLAPVPHAANPAAGAPSSPAPVPVPGELVTNDFEISPGQLTPTPGSSLVYVTGTIRNLSARQRFGVKIAFDLFDAQTNAVGKASDYQSTLEARAEWHFQALVLTSKATIAKFNSVAEK